MTNVHWGVLSVVGAALALGAALWYADTMQPSSIEAPVVEGAAENEVTVVDLEAGMLVTSPLSFSGEAEADWFSPDGTFVVALEDDNGQVFARGVAEVSGEAGNGLQAYTATIMFEAPDTLVSGMLVLQKHNPTGRPEDGGRVSFEVYFKDGTDTTGAL